MVGFSGVKDGKGADGRDHLSRVVTSLRGRIVNPQPASAKDVLELTHLVVGLPLGRTPKLCAAISLPRVSIVSQEWLVACETANSFVSPDAFVLKGEHSSSKDNELVWSFNASDSRKAAAASQCFAGRTFFITANTKPPTADLKTIVSVAGGTVLDRPPTASSGEVVLVSIEEEKGQWRKLAQLPNVTALRADHLLTCVLRQHLDLSNGRLGA